MKSLCVGGPAIVPRLVTPHICNNVLMIHSSLGARRCRRDAASSVTRLVVVRVSCCCSSPEMACRVTQSGSGHKRHSLQKSADRSPDYDNRGRGREQLEMRTETLYMCEVADQNQQSAQSTIIIDTDWQSGTQQLCHFLFIIGQILLPLIEEMRSC